MSTLVTIDTIVTSSEEGQKKEFLFLPVSPRLSFVSAIDRRIAFCYSVGRSTFVASTVLPTDGSPAKVTLYASCANSLRRRLKLDKSSSTFMTFLYGLRELKLISIATYERNRKLHEAEMARQTVTEALADTMSSLAAAGIKLNQRQQKSLQAWASKAVPASITDILKL